MFDTTWQKRLSIYSACSKKLNVLYSMDVLLMCSVLMFYEIQTDDILLLNLFLFLSVTVFYCRLFLAVFSFSGGVLLR